MEEELHKLVEIAAPRHPRLFFTEAEEAGLRAKIESDPLLDAAYGYLQGSADAILAAPPVKREVVGRRLLGVSHMLQPFHTWPFAYRLTKTRTFRARRGGDAGGARSRTGIRAISLPVAEMNRRWASATTGCTTSAPGRRTAIKTAIVDKGLNTSMRQRGGSNHQQLEPGMPGGAGDVGTGRAR